MAINFDTLPDKNPSTLENGKYLLTILKAEMRPSPDPERPPYLSLSCNIKDSKQQNRGKMYDNIIDSDSDLLRYKIRRFIEALEIPITSGNLELKDLAKIVPGKSYIADLMTERKEGKPPRTVVDIFSGEIYYPLKDASKYFEEAMASDDLPFNAPDAADAAAGPSDHAEY
jgi:hypothetical protein